MIYNAPTHDDPLDQGDIVRECPLASIDAFDSDAVEETPVGLSFEWCLVMTQTCDLAQKKSSRVTVPVVAPAAQLVASGELKEATIRGQIRLARAFGWYFLPADEELGLPELIVDFRQLHTVSREILETLCRDGHRKARLRTPFREHLAKHFADTYSRIGLPEPYATQ